jgi:hypothetical protein
MIDQETPPAWKILAVVIGFFIMCGAMGFGLLLLTQLVRADWQKVAGEWEQYRLNETQMNWFKSVRSKNGVPCCDISDGHPTEMKRHEDGIYIPDPMHTGGPWMIVPKEAMTIPGNNPIGVAVVWFVVQNGKTVHIRCFVPESEG